MKTTASFTLVALLGAMVFAFSYSVPETTIAANGEELELRLATNDLLVGKYDKASGTVTLTNLSHLTGAVFNDHAIPKVNATQYVVTSATVTHSGFNHFFIEFKGTHPVKGGMLIGVPLYVGKKGNPNPNFAVCEHNTHCCSGAGEISCKLGRDQQGCVNGCAGNGEGCSHTITTSTVYADFLLKIADNPGL